MYHNIKALLSDEPTHEYQSTMYYQFRKQYIMRSLHTASEYVWLAIVIALCVLAVYWFGLRAVLQHIRIV